MKIPIPFPSLLMAAVLAGCAADLPTVTKPFDQLDHQRSEVAQLTRALENEEIPRAVLFGGVHTVDSEDGSLAVFMPWGMDPFNPAVRYLFRIPDEASWATDVEGNKEALVSDVASTKPWIVHHGARVVSRGLDDQGNETILVTVDDWELARVEDTQSPGASDLLLLAETEPISLLEDERLDAALREMVAVITAEAGVARDAQTVRTEEAEAAAAVWFDPALRMIDAQRVWESLKNRAAVKSPTLRAAEHAKAVKEAARLGPTATFFTDVADRPDLSWPYWKKITSAGLGDVVYQRLWPPTDVPDLPGLLIEETVP
ncbi:MAG: hypothetical protein HY369_01270 [Candidatus Aenigmarchaeota archaeon]|nr:hypothetical protein [Candidatus Aenigmarchaeota archaeon]